MFIVLVEQYLCFPKEKLVEHEAPICSICHSTIKTDEHPQAVTINTDEHPQAVTINTDEHPQAITINTDEHLQAVHPKAVTINTDEHPQALSCAHVFHQKCINSWLKLHNTCPMCRRTVIPDALLPPENLNRNVSNVPWHGSAVWRSSPTMLIFQIIFFITKCCLTFQNDDFNNYSVNGSSSNQPSKSDDEFADDLKYALELSLQEEKDRQSLLQQAADDESMAMDYAIARSMEGQKNDAITPKHSRISSSIIAAASTAIAQAGRSISTSRNDISSINAAASTTIAQAGQSISTALTKTTSYVARLLSQYKPELALRQDDASSSNDAARHHLHGAGTSEGVQQSRRWHGESSTNDAARHHLHGESTSAVQSRRCHSDSSTNDAARHRLHSAGFPSVPSTLHSAASSSSASSSARRKKGKNKKKHESSSSNSITQKDLIAIDQMFADNIDPEIIYNKLNNIQTNESLQTVEVQSRLARVCFLRALNMPSDNDVKWKAKQQEIEKGLNFANHALAIDAQHLNALKYVCMLMGLQFDHRISSDQKISLAVNLNKFLQRANQSDPEILHAQGRLKYSLARISSFNRMLAIQINSGIKALFNDASYESAITKLLKAETFFQGTSIDNYFYLGKCYQRKGDKKLAKYYYDHLMGMEPKNLREKECKENTAKIKI
uniref:RING-type domain-containing protein n=1 Tax=Globodera rostochiensis TaxID=31243 RepID=A0A914HLH0_GLORO